MSDTKVKDAPIEEILSQMDAILEESPGSLIYIKWTCPKCGDRCVSDEPNTYMVRGYTHSTRSNGEHCGHTYTGRMFGILVALRID